MFKTCKRAQVALAAVLAGPMLAACGSSLEAPVAASSAQQFAAGALSRDQRA